MHPGSRSVADGTEAQSKVHYGSLPARMDEWSKVDYYRFCLFQRQVQQEFLHENHVLRARLEKVVPGTVHQFLATELQSQRSARLVEEWAPETESRKRPASDGAGPEMRAASRSRHSRESQPGSAAVPSDVDMDSATEARAVDRQSWRVEVERLEALFDSASGIGGSGSGTFEDVVSTVRLGSWREALLSAAQGHVVPDDPRPPSPPLPAVPFDVSSSPEFCSPGAGMELTPSRRNSGRSGSGLGFGSPQSASRRSRLPSVDATPRRASDIAGFSNIASLRAEGALSVRQISGSIVQPSLAPPSGDKGRRPRTRFPGDLRSLRQLRESLLGGIESLMPKEEIVKAEIDTAGHSAQQREGA